MDRLVTVNIGRTRKHGLYFIKKILPVDGICTRRLDTIVILWRDRIESRRLCASRNGLKRAMDQADGTCGGQL